MMKRLEQMKIYYELFWACKQKHGLDRLFEDAEFIVRFAQFQNTEYCEKWKLTPEYEKFLAWNDRD